VFSPTIGWAAGAIVSTADDLARFYRTLLGGRVLLADLLRKMETTRRISKDFGHGMGLMNLTLPCGLAWGHNGGIPVHGTWVLSRKDGGRPIVVLANLGEDSLGQKGERRQCRDAREGMLRLTRRHGAARIRRPGDAGGWPAAPARETT
jgi:D-alanyl-D-alanine carboxypeptidase